MKACGVDLNALRQTLASFIDEDLSSLVTDVDGLRGGADSRLPARDPARRDPCASSGRTEVTGANVLVAIFAERESNAAYFLQEQDMTRYDAVNFIAHGVAKDPAYGETRPVPAPNRAWTRGSDADEAGRPRRQGESALAKYCVDLNAKSQGRCRPADRPRHEVERCIQVLCRRRKNNPLLVGDPGVGKTAIAEGLAKKIVEGERPRCCRAPRSTRSTWARCWPARAIAAISRSG
jgi:ATP-dependent Clp protease ATP-binding subunit ClpA